MATLTYRVSDAVLTVVQDNDKRSVEIMDVNPVVERVFGFAPDDMVGKKLEDFLPAKLRELMREYIEYKENERDVGAVLGKVHGFSMHTKSGKDVPVKLRIIRDEVKGKHDQFSLIMQEESHLRERDSLFELMHENFKGHEVIDPRTGLPNRDSLVKNLELARYYSDTRDLFACFCVLSIDYYESLIARYGRDVSDLVIREIAAKCGQKLRGYDMICDVSPKELGILLFDINIESAHLVLNRLRWLVSANPLHIDKAGDIPVTVSIGFVPLGIERDGEAIISKCQQAIEKVQAKGGNAITETAFEADE